ncbi:hypothetical protein ACR5KS_03610 [Leucobacter sp. W1153]|uniref:hypothetical protein n=1 Tax=Leucobacter sp. W1153 TaxID=3439064 RepID=UPI003F347094
MNALQTVRESVATLASDATGAQAHPFMPGRLVPPAAIVLPGSPYLSSGDTFGTFRMGLEVVVVAAGKVNETASNTLDGLIVDTVVELVNAGISVSEVSDPWSLTVSNAEYLAATITTTQPVEL